MSPERIGVMGSSAGGHVAACAGTLYHSPQGRTGGALDAVNARPDFLILCYPVITMEARYTHAGSRQNLLGKHPSEALVEQYPLERQVTKDTPPTFLVAATPDQIVRKRRKQRARTEECERPTSNRVYGFADAAALNVQP